MATLRRQQAARSRASGHGGQAAGEPEHRARSTTGDLLRLVEQLSSFDRIGVTRLARHLEVPVPTAYRMLRALERAGYVEQLAESKEYRLTLKLFELGSRVASRTTLRDLAAVEVERLAQQAPDPHRVTPGGKPRARALGIPFGGRPGRWNAITDVPGVEVGYVTLIEGDAVRTGVTAIHPRGPGGTGDPVAAGFHAQNGNGEMTGVSWINESGTFNGPVAITNTHAVGVAHAGIIAWTVRHHPAVAEVWLLPVAAETWDGYLNDINGQHVTQANVVAAIEAAASGPVGEGSVGGGTGMSCYQFKGGSGTASRIVGDPGQAYTVGVFVQANFGARRELVLAGVPLGEALADDNPMGDFRLAPPGSGSVIAVVATDAPLFPHQCQALARRVTAGLARTGASGSHFSGDLFLAFSTANPGAFAPGEQAMSRLSFLPWERLDPYYEAVVQATEEAVVNALVANEDMTGRGGHRTPALPRARVTELLSAAGRLA